MYITENVNLLDKTKQTKEKSPMISFTIGSEFWVPGPGDKISGCATSFTIKYLLLFEF